MLLKSAEAKRRPPSGRAAGAAPGGRPRSERRGPAPPSTTRAAGAAPATRHRQHRRPSAARSAAAAPAVEARRPPPAPAAEPAPLAAEAAEVPAAAPRRPAPKPAAEPIPQLRPVPAGQSSIARRSGAAADDHRIRVSRSRRPACPAGPAWLRVPARRCPVRAARRRRAARAGCVRRRPIAPPARRPAGNGPFRPMGPGQRPAAWSGRPGMPTALDMPAPSTGGGRPGDRIRSHEDKAAAKKDREKELLLEKERQRKKKGDHATPAPALRTLESIEIPDLLTVQELATSMIVPVKDVITELIKMGTMATINQNIPSDVAIARRARSSASAPSSKRPAKKSRSSRKKTSRK